jgi:hypothetical protein
LLNAGQQVGGTIGLALIVTVAAIRVRRADLDGSQGALPG